MIVTKKYSDNDTSIERFLNLPEIPYEYTHYIAVVKHSDNQNNGHHLKTIIKTLIASLFSFGIYRSTLDSLTFQSRFKLYKHAIIAFVIVGIILASIVYFKSHLMMNTILTFIAVTTLCYSPCLLWYNLSNGIIVLKVSVGSSAPIPHSYCTEISNSSVCEMLYSFSYNPLSSLKRVFYTLKFIALVATDKKYSTSEIYTTTNLLTFMPQLNEHDKLFVVSREGNNKHITIEHIDIMAWNDLTNRQKGLDRAIDASGVKLDETKSCLRIVMSKIGASASEEDFVRSRIQLRIRTEALLDKTDNFISDTEAMLDRIAKEDEEMKRKGRELGFNW